jgi:hypothetical protein
MNILAAIKREERRVEKQLGKLNIRSAGGTIPHEVRLGNTLCAPQQARSMRRIRRFRSRK